MPLFNPRHLLLSALLSGAALLGAGAATAQDAKPAGWQTWTWDGSCYALIYAQSSTVPGTASERAYIAVKHVPKEKTFDGVAIVSGINIPGDAEGIIDVGGHEFSLLVFNNAGFVRSGEPERSLVDSLAKASEAKVTWFLKDQMAVQTYKLEGFAGAKKVIDAGCPNPAKAEASAPEEPAAKAKPKPSRRGRG